MNTIKEFQDKYNNNKIWVIKRTPCRHYYINQKICGRLFYPAYRKVTLCNVKKILGQIIKEIFEGGDNLDL